MRFQLTNNESVADVNLDKLAKATGNPVDMDYLQTVVRKGSAMATTTQLTTCYTLHARAIDALEVPCWINQLILARPSLACLI